MNLPVMETNTYDVIWCRAFDGWDQSNNVAGELKNAERNLPRVIHFSMAIVVVSDLTREDFIPGH